MPLLSTTQIHPVQIRETLAEIAQEKAPGTSQEKTLAGLLAKHQLTADDALEALGETMRTGETSAIRQRATETALKLNGLLEKDSGKGDFSVVINIIDPANAAAGGVNPILIPR
jgi:hypothetical protein